MSDSFLDYDREAFNRDLIDNTVDSARKSGLIAYLLWTFLGGFGVHNFYLGRPGQGAMQMGATLFGYCAYVSPDPWPWVGYAIGIPLGISLFIDLFKIPERVVACSERLRERLKENLSDNDWSDSRGRD